MISIFEPPLEHIAMKKSIILPIIFITVLLSVDSFSQTSESLQINIDSLETYKTSLLKKIDMIETEIDNLKILKNEQWVNEQSSQIYVFHKDGFLYDKEGSNTEVKKVKKGTKVLFVNDLDIFFYVVSYNGSVFTAKKRWVMLQTEFQSKKLISDSIEYIAQQEDSIAIIMAEPYIFISKAGIYKSSDDWKPFIEVDIGTEVLFVKNTTIRGYTNCLIIYKDEQYYCNENNLISSKDFSKEIEDKLWREQFIIDTYGNEIAQKIFAHKIWIGMTKEMMKLSWGVPDDINRTVTANSTSEQWIYGNQYVYVDDGIVTAWQD